VTRGQYNSHLGGMLVHCRGRLISLNRPSDSVRKIFGKLCGISRRSHYASEKVHYAANCAISLEKISHRTCTVFRFTITLKISEALHDVSDAK